MSILRVADTLTAPWVKILHEITRKNSPTAEPGPRLGLTSLSDCAKFFKQVVWKQQAWLLDSVVIQLLIDLKSCDSNFVSLLHFVSYSIISCSVKNPGICEI